MSLSAARVLATLSDAGPLRISDLAAQERCSQPTISNHIHRLEEAGLVRRTKDESDGRASVISLTNRGHLELYAMRNSVGRDLYPQLDTLPSGDQQVLRRSIEIMERLMADPTSSSAGHDRHEQAVAS